MMRDPDGHISFDETRIVRHIYKGASSSSFIRSNLASLLVREGMLVPYEYITDDKIISPRYQFITYPYEWTDAQFHDAADLTLRIARICEKSGYELKDASAWNIIFDGCKSIFCDHLSFKEIELREWWAFGQFARHFIYPLALSKTVRLNAHKVFLLYRDGLNHDDFINIIGSNIYLSRYLPLLLIRNTRKHPAAPLLHIKKGKTLHENLFSLAEYLLRDKRAEKTTAKWITYTEERAHYGYASIQLKREYVDNWINKVGPEWVVDFGANTGEFSHIARKYNCKVIAIDHDCMEKIYLNNSGTKDIYPVIAELGDMIGGRGWNGSEFPGLIDRMMNKIDMVMMLAIIHHLTISEGISLHDVFRLAHGITRCSAILELVDKNDSQARLLAAQRNRDMGDLSIEHQKTLLRGYFDIEDSIKYADGNRELVLARIK
ncbi:MAG: hypothetical protein ACRESK_04920 [Gammaproteobacteria bacterium]